MVIMVYSTYRTPVQATRYNGMSPVLATSGSAKHCSGEFGIMTCIRVTRNSIWERLARRLGSYSTTWTKTEPVNIMSVSNNRKPAATETYFQRHNAERPSCQATVTPETAAAGSRQDGVQYFTEKFVPVESADLEKRNKLQVQFPIEESSGNSDAQSTFFSVHHRLSKFAWNCSVGAHSYGSLLEPNLQIFSNDGTFRGDVEPSGKLGHKGVQKLPHSLSPTVSTQSERSKTRQTDATIDSEKGASVEKDQQSSGYSSSSLIQPSQVECIANTLRCVVVNILSINGLEKSYCSVIFDMKQLFERSSIPELSQEKELRLTQVVGIEDPSQFSWITKSEPVSGHGMEAIVYNSSSAPLLVIVPISDPITMEATSWVGHIRKLLVSVEVSKRPVVFLGISSYKLETTLKKQAALNKFGVRADHMFWLSDSSDASQVSSCCDEIRNILIKSAPTSQPHLLEVEKLILLERCQNRKLMSPTDLHHHGGTPDPKTIRQYLEAKGLVASFPVDVITMQVSEGAQSTNAKPEFISAASSWTGDKGSEGQIVLEPKTFSDEVTKLMTLCANAYIEVNDCLVPSARHGLLTKDKLKPKIDATVLSLLHVLHKSGILLDPLLAGGDHPDSSEKTHTVRKVEHDEIDARYCYLVPSCLDGESHLLPLPGYHGITPLAFRSPGCYRRDIPLSLFYQLVAYMMCQFPFSVKCSRYGARFHIAPQHILDITYSQMYIKVVAYIHDKTQMLSSGTSAICSSVRTVIGEHLDTLSKAAGSLVLHVAALIEDSTSSCPDFVDLPAVDPLSGGHELNTVGGQLFSPSDDFFLWFGRSGPEPSIIQKKFRDLADLIDAERAASWLYQAQVLEGPELDQILGQDADGRCQLLLRLLEKKGGKGLEAVDAVLHQNLLKKHRTYGVNSALQQTSPNPGDILTHPGDGNEEANHPLPWLAAETQSPQDEYQLEQSGSQRPLAIANIQQQNITPGTREQTLNQLSQISKPTAIRTESSTGVKSTPGNLPSHRPFGDDISSSQPLDASQHSSRLGSQNGTVCPPSVTPQAPVTSPVLSPTIASSQQTQPVTATSSSTTYTGLQQQQLAFPRSIISPQSSIARSAARRVSEAQPPAASQGRTLNIKGDPEIHPIFESKYWHVERATDYFNDAPFEEGGKRLGAGSFATVFHGVLHSEAGQKFDVAVKRLKKASSLNPAQVELSRKQFGVEMKILTRYVHKNIVHLVGFSSDGPELCLIYEYMQNGALSHRLDCKDKSAPLDWKVRLTISRDIASALEFLHTAYREPVIHRDVKSANVLLGANFEAKLSDFGLAVIGNVEGDLQIEPASQVSVGTRPYMPPEAFQRILTTKIDVYSFGMMLFELATGLPPYSSRKKQDLIAYMEGLEHQNVNMTKMLDPKAQWPKTRGWGGRDNTVGLELLELAKLASTRDLSRRPDIVEILPKLMSLTQRVELK